MNKYGKIWGSTTCLESNNSIEVHEIEFQQGKRCSFHCHNTKFNAFYVVEGELEISVKKSNYDLTDVTILSKGDFTVVPPGEYHQFRGLTNGKALEVYWAEFNPNDIVRANTGG